MAAARQLPERQRNALLRRVDWRFLLPLEPEPTSVCFASGGLERAVGFVSADCARDWKPESADVAVVADQGGASLAAAWAALRPGGHLWVERSTRIPRSPARLRERLERAG